jgi:hypothetical protein
MKVKICPKCGTRYEKMEDQFRTVCPLKHCPHCGGLKMDEDFVGGGVGGTFALIVGLFGGLIAMSIGSIIVGLIIIVVTIIISIPLFSLRRCLNCDGYFLSFNYERNVPLKEVEVEKKEEWEEI